MLVSEGCLEKNCCRYQWSFFEHLIRIFYHSQEIFFPNQFPKVGQFISLTVFSKGEIFWYSMYFVPSLQSACSLNFGLNKSSIDFSWNLMFILWKIYKSPLSLLLWLKVKVFIRFSAFALQHLLKVAINCKVAFISKSYFSINSLNNYSNSVLDNYNV